MGEHRPDSSSDRRFFLFLVAFRWASLFPALWLLFQPQSAAQASLALPALALSAGNTLLITIFYRGLNRLLVRRPLLLGVDLFFTTGLLAISGGVHSPYYLYALSPLLAGAFFFQLRGALAISAANTSMYFLALAVAGRVNGQPPDSIHLFTQLAGIWLIPILFAYPALLLNRLRETSDALETARDDLAEQNQELGRMNRQLEIIHELTVLLQAAPDLHSVQQRVLRVVTEELGFPSAAVGLFDPLTEALGEWQCDPPRSAFQASIRTPDRDTSQLLNALQVGKPVLHDSELLGMEFSLAESHCLGVQLNLREHPVGILLVHLEAGADALTVPQLEMLKVVARQAAVALGTTIVCIDRARRLAVEQERNRIARDIHDTVAQSLFGIVFSLDACAAMLPDQGEQVKAELLELRELASSVRDEVRSSVFDLWPGELTRARFEADLASSVSQCCRPHTFQVDFRISESFERLSPILRRTLFRVTQEALTNAARHSGAGSAQVCLELDGEQVHLLIRDGGRGFNPETVLAQERDGDHFGLHGMRQRIQALGGQSEIYSREQHGTLILASLPLHTGSSDGF